MAALARRECYCPAHFGNSYEVMWPREMRDYLTELKFWGFNAYGDWFDAADLKAPWNNPRGEHLLPQALWQRKLTHFRSADDVGLEVDLLITPNHVFLDQLRDDLLADTSEERYFGQLLCPSRPEGREIIVGNYRRMFGDLQQQGVELDAMSACPMDYGGCACAECAPWIVTFGRLFAEIHDAAREFFPGVKARLVGWWWTREEHAAFAEWANAGEPGRFPSLAAYIRYGETRPDLNAPLPDGCERHAFVHVGYADRAKPDDLYGPWGPTIAPERIEQTVRELEAGGVTGFMAYSEGVFDDVNKALLAGLGSGQFGSAAEVLEAYAERYLGAAGADRRGWADWLARWGRPYEMEVPSARREYAQLAEAAKPGWRLAQLEAKLSVFEAHTAVCAASEWPPARVEAAERFFAERERLQRGIWGLGLVRHVLNERYHRPSWFQDWQAHAERKGSDQDQLPDEA